MGIIVVKAGDGDVNALAALVACARFDCAAPISEPITKNMMRAIRPLNEVSGVNFESTVAIPRRNNLIPEAIVPSAPAMPPAYATIHKKKPRVKASA